MRNRALDRPSSFPAPQFQPGGTPPCNRHRSRAERAPLGVVLIWIQRCHPRSNRPREPSEVPAREAQRSPGSRQRNPSIRRLTEPLGAGTEPLRGYALGTPSPAEASGARQRGHLPGARETTRRVGTPDEAPQLGHTAAASRTLALSSRRYEASWALIMRSVRRIHLLMSLLITSWHVGLVLLVCAWGRDAGRGGFDVPSIEPLGASHPSTSGPQRVPKHIARNPLRKAVRVGIGAAMAERRLRTNQTHPEDIDSKPIVQLGRLASRHLSITAKASGSSHLLAAPAATH